MNRNLLLLPTAIIFLLGGCALTPEYKRPESPVPSDWPTGAAYSEQKLDESSPLVSELSWREFITDTHLQEIIGMALDNNRDLRLAALNVERARALYGIRRAELLPTVEATGRESKERIPADLSSSGKSMTTERYDVNLGVSSWEIDFFGRIRSLKDRALEEYLAEDQARRTAQILLISAVANTYLTLAADRESLKLVESTLKTQED
jgi:multidrug efflux system outer membrane protein